MAAAVSQVKGFLGLEEGGAGQSGNGDFDLEAMCGIKLSKTTRLIGFASCLGLGFLCSFISFFYWAKPVSFALLYTFGNIIALVGTGFLVGFLKQVKNMFASKRIVATVLFLVSLVGTLLAVFLIPDPTGKFFGAIFCIVIQFCCLVWYTASYIPFAQDFLKGMCGRCVRTSTAT